MRVQFVEVPLLLPRQLGWAELVFDDDDAPLAGLRLVGLQLWRGFEGDVRVSFPWCASGRDCRLRYVDYLLGDEAAANRLEAFVVDAFERDKPLRTDAESITTGKAGGLWL